MKQRVLLGGYSSEVPPLPIPNREVKLTNADGTAYLGGRVGSRLFKRRPNENSIFSFLFLLAKPKKVSHLFGEMLAWRGGFAAIRVLPIPQTPFL